MELTNTINSSFSRTRGNELNKGFYPTFPTDIQTVLHIVEPSFGWKNRRYNALKTISVLDPCAGEGEFLTTVTRWLKRRYAAANGSPHEILSYAVELDTNRFDKIHGATQKLNTSFFDVEISGKFNLILLNPPYNKAAGNELVTWMEKTAPLLAYEGVMVLIIPEYELKGRLLEIIQGTFPFAYALQSEEYARFKQVVVFLAKDQDNSSEIYHQYVRYQSWPAANLGEGATRVKYTVPGNKRQTLSLGGSSGSNRPLMTARDLTEFYRECEIRIDKAADMMLDRQYPSSYDTSIQPISTLRTAHAVQLAAMNSQIESVTINGEFFLAKFMVITKTETFKDPETNSETTVCKPTVEAFLMDRHGNVQPAREHGFDYYELNSRLSSVLLQKLSRLYQPLHEIGQDETYLVDELQGIGLLPPQREAVKAVIKAYRTGRRGVGIRANTGTGKTWIAKAVKYLTRAKRTVMVSEPQLIPQLVREYASEGFAVHVIDSWDALKKLSVSRPYGLYLIAYTRLRMHPKYRLCIKSRKTIVKKDGHSSVEYAEVCPSCRSPLAEKIRKGDKPKCAYCGEPLFTYIPENDRPEMTYRRWISEIENNGTATEARTHNKQLPYIRLLKRIPFDLAIFDEVHNAANLMSNQGTAFIRLAATAKKVLALTATVTNGMAKSIYNILWGLNPQQMRDAGWDMKSATDFQTKYGAFKTVRKTDEKNRHRESERVTTYDTAGISPAALIFTIPNFVNVDSDDFDDLPPVEREVIKCQSHALVETCYRSIENIIDKADLPPEDLLAASSVRNAAFLRVSDSFRHYNDELKLRDIPLGTLHRLSLPDGELLLEKEEKLIGIAQGVIDRGERLLVYTGNTQKIDMRPVLKQILRDNVQCASVEVLPDSVAPDKLVEWFEQVTAQLVVVSFHRVATGLNLSQFNNLVWYDYTSNTRLAEQGDGRIRRVNTADIHRVQFGEVRPVRYWYLTSSEVQALQLAYTLEKRMVAKLAEGETPDIDPAECSSSQSFSSLMTKALKEGNFNYTDPSSLLKKMTQHENAKVRGNNKGEAPIKSNIIQLPITRQEPAPTPPCIAVIHCEGGREVTRDVPFGMYQTLLNAGNLEFTLFGVYVRNPAIRQKYA